MSKSSFKRATAVALGVGTLAGAAVYDGWARSGSLRAGGPDQGALVVALADTRSPSDVVVVVNGHEVTQAEVDREIDAMLGGQLEMIPPDQLNGVREQLAKRVTDGVVVKTLLEQAVDANGVEVDQDRLAASLAEIEAALPPGTSLADYAETVGMTSDEITREVATSLRVEALVAESAGSIETPTREEIRAFYDGNEEMFALPERVEVRHVLLSVPPEADEATRTARRQEAEALRGKLTAEGGADFAEIAAQHSDCPSKANGGNLGEITRGQTVAEFETAAFEQEVGVIGPIVETSYGFHLVRVDGRSEAGVAPLAQVETYIQERLVQERRRVAFESFVEGLRAKAQVVYPGNESA